VATGQLTRSGRVPLRLRGTPVFLYHGLTSSLVPDCPLRERRYWVAPSQFLKHLDCASAEGRRVALLSELWDSENVLTRENPLTALTFDDGHISNYEIAFPLLIGAGVRAEFFVNTANIGTKGFLSWQQVTEMQRAGMSFQSHSHDHVDLVRLRPWEKQHQLKHSKQTLEDRLGRKVEFLAVPFGRLCAEISRIAIETGYRSVCTSRSWPARPGARLLNRVVVYGHTSQNGFRKLLLGNPVSYAIRAVRAAALSLPKHLHSRLAEPQEPVTGLENSA